MTAGWERPLTRRRFVATAAAAAGSLGSLGALARAASAAPAALPAPAHSGIDHVVVVMMENRSFDHFMGWLPSADGKQAGLTYLDPKGARARDVSARAGLPGLRLRSIPTIRTTVRAWSGTTARATAG